MARYKLVLALMCTVILFPGSARTQERGSAKWVLEMKSNTPLQQSECEVASIKAALAHPRTEISMFMDRYHSSYFNANRPPEAPFTYRDAASGIVFYRESDGRHLVAMDANGKLLWTRNPFVDSDMCPYRFAHPYIYSLGPAQPIGKNADVNASILKELEGRFGRGRRGEPPRIGDKFIRLEFNSSNFGYVNVRNGNYYDMGQN